MENKELDNKKELEMIRILRSTSEDSEMSDVFFKSLEQKLKTEASLLNNSGRLNFLSYKIFLTLSAAVIFFTGIFLIGSNSERIQTTVADLFNVQTKIVEKQRNILELIIDTFKNKVEETITKNSKATVDVFVAGKSMKSSYKDYNPNFELRIVTSNIASCSLTQSFGKNKPTEISKKISGSVNVNLSAESYGFGIYIYKLVCKTILGKTLSSNVKVEKLNPILTYTGKNFPFSFQYSYQLGNAYIPAAYLNNPNDYVEFPTNRQFYRVRVTALGGLSYPSITGLKQIDLLNVKTKSNNPTKILILQVTDNTGFETNVNNGDYIILASIALAEPGYCDIGVVGNSRPDQYNQYLSFVKTIVATMSVDMSKVKCP